MHFPLLSRKTLFQHWKISKSVAIPLQMQQKYLHIVSESSPPKWLSARISAFMDKLCYRLSLHDHGLVSPLPHYKGWKGLLKYSALISCIKLAKMSPPNLSPQVHSICLRPKQAFWKTIISGLNFSNNNKLNTFHFYCLVTKFISLLLLNKVRPYPSSDLLIFMGI